MQATQRQTRKLLDFSTEFLQDLRIEVAQSQEDFLAALEVVHDGYVERGVMEPQKSGYRLTKYHLLNTTTTVVAKYKGEVVATLSLILDTSLGLPMDSGWDLSALRRKGLLIGEVSALSIKKEFRRHFGRMIFLMCKYILRYASEVLQLDAFVISTDARSARFYSGLMGFSELKADAVAYEFVQGEKSIGQWLDLKKWLADVRAYGSQIKELERMTYSYAGMSAFCGSSTFDECLIYPSRPYYKPADSVLSPELFDYLLNGEAGISLREQLSEDDLFSLQALYGYSSFQKPLEKFIGPVSLLRSEGRCLSGVQAKVVAPSWLKGTEVRLADISEHGAGILSKLPLLSEGPITLELSPFGGRSFRVSGLLKKQNDARYGLRLGNWTSKNWQKYVSTLQKHFRFVQPETERALQDRAI